MRKVISLEQYGLPTFSMAPSDWAQSLEDALVNSEATQVYTVFSRPFGRGTYFFAVVELPDPVDEPVEEPVTRSTKKAKPAPQVLPE